MIIIITENLFKSLCHENKETYFKVMTQIIITRLFTDLINLMNGHNTYSNTNDNNASYNL